MKRTSLLVGAGILAVIAFVMSQAPTGAQERGPVTQWEYKVLAKYARSQDNEAKLNELGAEGWEAVCGDIEATTITFLLKRPTN
jgi:hypothetical protein